MPYKCSELQMNIFFVSCITYFITNGIKIMHLSRIIWSSWKILLNFKDSKIPTYQRMWSFMESTKPSVFVNGNPDGVERVKKENGFYAFLMESTSIEYTVERNCDTIQIGGLLDSKGYGIALPPGIFTANKCDFYSL